MNTPSPSVHYDFHGIAELRYHARQDQAGSLERVARQFESLFVQMMVKQMRQASFGGGILDSDRTRQYQDMYDKQLALHLSESGGLGIAEVLQRQLDAGLHASSQTPAIGLNDYRSQPVIPAVPKLSVKPIDPLMAKPPVQNSAESPPDLDTPEQFVDALWPAARPAADQIGLPPEALLAQAALETGWGAHVMPSFDGRSSHNLFGIKADHRWEGARVKRETLEYENGVAVRRREFFRAYDSYEESFEDYVSFLKQNPRYAVALANTHDSEAYFKALQQAGYATDPHYAEKILGLLQGSQMQQSLTSLKSDVLLPL
jgi:flagellar protein FlgJ